MAFIFDVAAQTFIPLAPHHTFGRLSSAVNTHISKPYISKLHAAIEWDGNEWRVKNLGQNGSWLNGQLLPHGEPVHLNKNDVIHFADLKDPGFKVIDLTAPGDMLWPLDVQALLKNQSPIYLSRYHLLPDSPTPDIAVYFEQSSQSWKLEHLQAQVEEAPQTLENGSIIQLHNQPWQLILVQVYSPTQIHRQKTQALSDYEFIFQLSLDEETTELVLKLETQTIDFAVRTHHYLLAQLIRHRVSDAEKGLDEKSQGWIYTEQLARELGVDATHLNIQIFRLRKQFADTLPHTTGLETLLERRGGKIRFGCNRAKIFKGSSLTTLLSPTRAYSTI